MILYIACNLWRLKFISVFYKILVPSLQGTRHFSFIKSINDVKENHCFIFWNYRQHTRAYADCVKDTEFLNVTPIGLPAWDEKFFCSPKISRPNLVLAQPPITNVPAFFPGDKAAAALRWPLTLSPRAKNEWSCTCTSSIYIHGVSRGQILTFWHHTVHVSGLLTGR